MESTTQEQSQHAEVVALLRSIRATLWVIAAVVIAAAVFYGAALDSAGTANF